MSIKKMSFVNALVHAQEYILDKNSNAFLIGQDINDHKRFFGSTRGLVEKFGENRNIMTPLSEDAMAGVALGAALNGMRPIFTHIRSDFIALCCNQIINMYSNIKYLSAGRSNTPVLIRSVIGRGWGQGAQHSKPMHGLFSQFPGLEVVLPATPQDAYSLMIDAFEKDYPTIFLEHRWLYDIEGDVDTNKKDDFSKAKIVCHGKDITVLTFSWMLYEALQARDILSPLGIDLEIINLRSSTNIDINTIADSIKKTNHCVVCDYDWIKNGTAAEVSSLIHENIFESLKKPVQRIGFAPFPCPTARHLENEFYPSSLDIIKSIQLVLDLNDLEIPNYQTYSYENHFKGPF